MHKKKEYFFFLLNGKGIFHNGREIKIKKNDNTRINNYIFNGRITQKKKSLSQSSSAYHTIKFIIKGGLIFSVEFITDSVSQVSESIVCLVLDVCPGTDTSSLGFYQII